MKKSNNELRTELANLNQVMSNIGSSIQQSVGILGQLLSNQSMDFPPPTYPQHTSTSTLVEPQPFSQDSDNVNEDQS